MCVTPICAGILACSSALPPDPSPRPLPSAELSTPKRRLPAIEVPSFSEVYPTGLPQVCRLGTMPIATFIRSHVHEQCPCEVKDPSPPGMVSTGISCGNALENFEPQALLDIEYGPHNVTVRYGESVTFHFSVSNPQDTDVPLILTDIPGRQVFVREWPTSSYCDYGSNGGPWKYAVALKPGARLSYEYTWDVTHMLWPTTTAEQCVMDTRPLPTGRYRVFWRSPAVVGKGRVGWSIELTVVP